jgi:hypothetical protein
LSAIARKLGRADFACIFQSAKVKGNRAEDDLIAEKRKIIFFLCLKIVVFSPFLGAERFFFLSGPAFLGPGY